MDNNSYPSSDSNYESRKCASYFREAADEMRCDTWLADQSRMPVLFIPEGFEERSIGFLRKVAQSGSNVPFLVLARYKDTADLNVQYRQEFEELAQKVAPGRWRTVMNINDSTWIEEAIELAGSRHVLLDISGLTTRSLYAALDFLRKSQIETFIGYSEAGEYRPTKKEWDDLVEATEGDPDAASLLAEMVDEAKWLYSGAHTVKLIEGHEGYDAAGVNALVAFLPFKPVRLGSLLGEQQYSSYVYIAGRPRLPENKWRLDALKQMNASILRHGKMVEVSTFGYRSSLNALGDLVCGSQGLLTEFDVHVAPMGSKLQNLSCWILSCLVPAVTLITSVPNTWYPESYSHKVGESWVLKLKMPSN